jgi:Ca-activated chloride channel homolog
MDQQIKVSMALSQRFIRPDDVQTVYMMVQLAQPVIELGDRRMPLNVSFVLDRSGSMAGDKLAYTKKAVNFALGNLNAADMASVVVFDDRVDVLLPPENVVHKDAMTQKVSALWTGGCTNLSGGLLKGSALVRENLAEGFVNRVIMLTDGLANRGVTYPSRITEMVREIAVSRISVSTLGVGEDFQEDLLVDMAEAGSGNFYFIESADKIPEIFQQELQGLLSVTAQNMALAFRPANGVVVSGVMGYQPSWGEEVSIALPDMYSGEVKTLLFELQVATGAAGPMDLGCLSLRYDNVAGKLSTVSYTIDISADVTDDEKLIESGFSMDVVKEVEIFRTAEVKEQAIKMADNGEFTEAAQLIQRQKKILENILADNDDNELREQLDALKENAFMLRDDSYSSLNRKTMKSQSFQSRRKR